jgi:hypothetical protein
LHVAGLHQVGLPSGHLPGILYHGTSGVHTRGLVEQYVPGARIKCEQLNWSPDEEISRAFLGRAEESEESVVLQLIPRRQDAAGIHAPYHFDSAISNFPMEDEWNLPLLTAAYCFEAYREPGGPWVAKIEVTYTPQVFEA